MRIIDCISALGLLPEGLLCKRPQIFYVRVRSLSVTLWMDPTLGLTKYVNLRREKLFNWSEIDKNPSGPHHPTGEI